MRKIRSSRTRLASVIPSNKNHKLYFDNWFNSPEIQVFLAKRGIFSIGTLRLARAAGLTFPNLSITKENRGTHFTKSATFTGVKLFAVRWLDNKEVTLLSSFVASSPGIEVNRYNRTEKKYETVKAPGIVKAYNTHMGYVDEINSYLGRFGMTTHCRSRAYIKIFLHFLNIIATNAWILYRRDCEDVREAKKNVLNLFDFKANLASALCKVEIKTSTPKRKAQNMENELKMQRKRGGPKTSLPVKDVRQDGMNHWPAIGNRGPRCKNPLCDAKPTTYCTKCNVHLCITARNCFYDFHNT